MSLVNVATRLIENESFREKLDHLAVDSVLAQFENSVIPNESNQILTNDWHHLLLSASVLLSAEREDCQSSALRIAVHCIQSNSSNDGEKAAAMRILQRLSIQPAIDLSIAREMATSDSIYDESVFGTIERVRNRLESTVVLADGSELRLNRFQRSFWRSIEGAQWLSVSAPTSGGKSFVVLQWLGESIRNGTFKDAIYLVPTRALISQVERDLKNYAREAGLGINVTSIPRSESLKEDKPNVLVFTQERLHFFLNETRGIPDSFGAIVVDEAQKIGDSYRGILLQDVLERVTSDAPDRKVVFLSPMTENPELLLRDSTANIKKKPLLSSNVTVNQNLLWVDQAPRDTTKWIVSACIGGEIKRIGKLNLPQRPVPDSKRLPFVALALSSESGNLIYVNGAADAEKAARQLYDCLEDVENTEIDEVIELVKHAIHPDFQLATTLRRGIGFHYGNMPLLVKTKIEELFSSGVLRFLVCTSTLVEGVNMSCRNIFVRGPKKGKTDKMSEPDFWNLAGRAGRLGKEFHGNIICVDTSKPDLWRDGKPPKLRKRFTIVRSADIVLANPSELVAFINSDTPRELAEKRPDLEFTFSYLAAILDRYGRLTDAPWAKHFDEATLLSVETSARQALERIEIPAEIIKRNIGISPCALQSLLELFRERTAEGKPVEELVPSQPGSDDTVDNFTKIFSRIYKSISRKLGPPPKRTYMLALLVSQWMSGFPLSRLITNRISYELKKAKKKSGKESEAVEINKHAIIRKVMEDIEQIARFSAPRAMTAYVDVLRFYFTEIKRKDLANSLEDLGIYLELGLSLKTQMSLVSIGLSRSSAIALSHIISEDSLTPDQCLDWLKETPLDSFELPILIRKEIKELIFV